VIGIKHGGEITLGKRTLNAGETQNFDITTKSSSSGEKIQRWGDGSKANSQYGNAVIKINSHGADASTVVAAWIMVSNKKDGIFFAN